MSATLERQIERIKWARFIDALEKEFGVVTYRIRNIFSRSMSEGFLNEMDKSHAMDNLAWCREYRAKWGL